MLERFRSFFADPYVPDMDAADWFLFIGFLIICLFLWRRIAYTFASVAESAVS